MSATPTDPIPLSDEAVALLLEEVLSPGGLDDIQAGDVVGAYRLVEKLGEGGFGVVWLADQLEPVQRRVALKMVKLGVDTQGVLARFEQERHVLARMTHPNIATLIDAGMADDGRPYVVMELVEGLPLTRYCQDHKTPLRERVALFRDVCLGVHHAHQKGIIHRDLKPSNILVAEVDGRPVPKIIDFGIAMAATKRTAASKAMARAVIGTPFYMSPEQLENAHEVDTRSDIYALGALLYELLTGQPPFDVQTLTTKGEEELHRLIREVTPLRPSRCRSGGTVPPSSVTLPVFRSLPGDLDWIVLHALEKDPGRRYASAAEFAADLKHFLANEPVDAHPPSTQYFVRRWIRRHRSAFVGGCVSALAMIIGTGVALRLAAAARQARATAESQRELAVQAEGRATLESIRAQQVSAFLSHLLDNAADEIEKGRNPEALRLALDRSGTQLNELKRDPTLQVHLLGRLIELYSTIAEWKTALDLMHQRANLLATLHGKDSEISREAELSYLKRLADHGQRVTAPPLLEALLARVERKGERGSKYWFEVHRELSRVWLKLDDGHRALKCSTEAMTEASTQKLKGKSVVTVWMTHVAALESVHDFAAAEALLEKCQALATKSGFTGSLPKQINDRLFYILKAQRDFTRGAQIQREQLATYRAAPNADSREMLRLLDRLTEFESSAGQHDQAAEHGRDALDLARHLADEPGDDRDSFRAAIGQGLRRLAAIKSDAGHHDEALRYATEARVYAEDQGNKFDILQSIQAMAYALRNAGRLDEAYRAFEEYHHLRQMHSADYRTRVGTLEEMRGIRMTQRRYDEALELSRQMWPQKADGPVALSDVEHLGNVSRFALAAWKALHKADPKAPTPPELKLWTQADEAWAKIEAERKAPLP